MTNYNDEEINFLIEENKLRKAMIEGKQRGDAEGREAKYAYHEFRKYWRQIRECGVSAPNAEQGAVVSIDAIEATSSVKEEN